MDATQIQQHDIEIHENARAWKAKRLLRAVYTQFYRQIRMRLGGGPGLTVELGSGLGNIKTEIPACITTDLFPNPWLDRNENAYALSFADGSVENLILFDVWHHLQFPSAAMREFKRVLAPGGRLILFEPAMGLFPKFVYGLFHHEPLGLKKPVEWEPLPDFNPQNQTYYAAQGNCWRMFRLGEAKDKFPEWLVLEVATFPAIAYLASGGFRGPQLMPDWMFPLVRMVESVVAGIPSVFASRMLVVMEKKSRQ